MPASSGNGPSQSQRAAPSESQTHFAVAAKSLTALYKLAHLAEHSATGGLRARDEVRRFARMAAVELPGSSSTGGGSGTPPPNHERHRGRRFVALDELLNFLDAADGGDLAAVPHTFGRKRDASNAVRPSFGEADDDAGGHYDFGQQSAGVGSHGPSRHSTRTGGADGLGDPLSRRHRAQVAEADVSPRSDRA